MALSVNDSLTLDLKLEVGQVSEVVTVSEAPSAVNTETSVIGRTVDNRTLNDLPILSGANGRNPLALAPLQAGVMPRRPGWSILSQRSARSIKQLPAGWRRQ